MRRKLVAFILWSQFLCFTEDFAQIPGCLPLWLSLNAGPGFSKVYFTEQAHQHSIFFYSQRKFLIKKKKKTVKIYKLHPYTLNAACYSERLSQVENIFGNKGSQSLSPVGHLYCVAIASLLLLQVGTQPLDPWLVCPWLVFFFQLAKQI